MVIDTDKLDKWVTTHLKIVLACAFWTVAWFTSVRCTGVPPAPRPELPTVVEMFWFFTSALFFVLAAISTGLVFYKMFGTDLRGISKDA